MPLRKSRTVIALTACSIAGSAMLPAASQAGILSSLFKSTKKAATTTTYDQSTKAVTTVSNGSTAAPAAGAPVVTSTAVPKPSGCQELPTTKAFQKVDGDSADYSPAPGGDFEPGAAGWTLTGGAQAQVGNESLGVKSGARSLKMPLGSTATSPNFCVDQNHPHFRFAYKVDNAVLSGFIAYVVWRDSKGAITNIELVSSKVLNLLPTLWQATPNSPLATLLPLDAATRSASVQLKITALNPTELVQDVSDATIGQVPGVNVLVNPLMKLVTGVGGAASGLVAATTATLTPANIGVSIDSVMVDPYRRG